MVINAHIVLNTVALSEGITQTQRLARGGSHFKIKFWPRMVKDIHSSMDSNSDILLTLQFTKNLILYSLFYI